MHAGGLRQPPQVELDNGFVRLGDVELVELGLVLDVGRVEPLVGHILDHGVGDVSDAAQPGRLQRKLGGRDIDAHAPDHDRNELFITKVQPEIVDALHQESFDICTTMRRAVSSWDVLARNRDRLGDGESRSLDDARE